MLTRENAPQMSRGIQIKSTGAEQDIKVSVLASSWRATAAGVGVLHQKPRSPRQIKRVPRFHVGVIGKMLDGAQVSCLNGPLEFIIEFVDRG